MPKFFGGGSSGGGLVTSVFGRIGGVIAAIGDYLASQVNNDSSVSGATVKDALNTLLNQAGPTPVRGNKGMVASTTENDFDLACATAVATTPASSSAAGGGVGVRVNGVSYIVGDGVKTKDCYFSGDGGATARALRSVVAGDLLYWVGSVALFQLATGTDKIDFVYDVTI